MALIFDIANLACAKKNASMKKAFSNSSINKVTMILPFAKVFSIVDRSRDLSTMVKWFCAKVFATSGKTLCTKALHHGR